MRAAGAATLGALAGLAAASSPRFGFLALVAAAVLASAAHVLARRSFDPLAAAMFVTLPLQSAFVIDVGFSVRVSYIFGGLAILSAVLFGCFRRVHQPAARWLAAFAVVVVASLIFTPMAPAASFGRVSGFRGLYGLRPIIQCCQLALMIGCMMVTYSYCTSPARLRRAAALVMAGGLFALSYGVYGFVALLTHSTYIEINNAMNTDFGRGYREQGNSYAGGYIPRPRSTFQEPLNFGNFLIVIIGLSALLRMHARGGGRARLGWTGVLLLAVLLFLIGVNSRGAIFGTFVAAASLALFVRRPAQALRASGTVVAWLLLVGVAAGVFVQYRYKGGVPVFAAYLGNRLTSALESGNRVSVDWDLMAPLVYRHPVLGVGFGNLPFYWGQLEGAAPLGVTEAGGLYMRLLAEVGVVGTALYLGFIAALLLRLRRAGTRPDAPRELRWAAAALFFIIVADAVQRIALVGIATDTSLWVVYGLALAVPALAARPPAAEPAG